MLVTYLLFWNYFSILWLKPCVDTLRISTILIKLLRIHWNYLLTWSGKKIVDAIILSRFYVDFGLKLLLVLNKMLHFRKNLVVNYLQFVIPLQN